MEGQVTLLTGGDAVVWGAPGWRYRGCKGGSYGESERSPIGRSQRVLFMLLETSGRATRESGIATEAPHSGPKQTMLTPHANRHPALQFTSTCFVAQCHRLFLASLQSRSPFGYA